MMYKAFHVLLIAFMLFAAIDAKAQTAGNYIEEMQGLGVVAGEGMACRASRYDDYELLARAYLITKATSDYEQKQGMDAYNSAKVTTYMTMRRAGFYDCREILQAFDNQLIFKTKLYADGTIHTPDGKILTPRQPYDASKIYEKDPKLYENIKKIVDKASAKTKNKKLKLNYQQ